MSEANLGDGMQFLIKLIDNMPYGKKEKEKEKIKEKIKIKSIELYTNAHPKTTIKGTSYKNKKTALNTLELIKDESLKNNF